MIYKRKLDFLAGFLISALMLACRVYYISIVSDPSVLTSAHLASFPGSRVRAEPGNEASVLIMTIFALQVFIQYLYCTFCDCSAVLSSPWGRSLTAALIVGLQVLDELLPKATGREARIEKKRARAEERRAREISPGKVLLLFNLSQA